MARQLSGFQNMNSQGGIVLIVGLIIVLLMSIIALAAIRGSGLQEAMSGNMRDRNIAFQGAESGLVEGEARLNFISVAMPPICDNLDHGGLTCWEDLDAVPANSLMYIEIDSDFKNRAFESTMDLGKVSSKPQYVLERLPETSVEEGGEVSMGGANDITKRIPYRVTSKGFGITQESQVIVQSTYNRLP